MVRATLLLLWKNLDKIEYWTGFFAHILRDDLKIDVKAAAAASTNHLPCNNKGALATALLAAADLG